MKTLMHILTILWCGLFMAVGAVILISAFRDTASSPMAYRTGYLSVPVLLLALSGLSLVSYRFLIGLGLYQLLAVLIVAWSVLKPGFVGVPLTKAFTVAIFSVPVLITFGLFAWNRASRSKTQSSPVAEF